MIEREVIEVLWINTHTFNPSGKEMKYWKIVYRASAYGRKSRETSVYVFAFDELGAMQEYIKRCAYNDKKAAIKERKKDKKWRVA